MTPPTLPTTVALDDAVDDLFWAFRYALGRQSAVVSIVAERLIAYAHLIPAHRRAQIAREITEAEQQEGPARDLFGGLGMAIDAAYWRRVRDAMEGQG